MNPIVRARHAASFLPESALISSPAMRMVPAEGEADRQAAFFEEPHGRGRQPQEHEPHVADAGVGDHSFEVGLGESHDRAVEEAARGDHRHAGHALP